MTAAQVDVLVVGAGPAGLTVAIELARRGIDCRVVDCLPQPRRGVRCPTLWPRTVELLESIGVPMAGPLRDGRPLRRKVFHIGGDTAGMDLGGAAARPTLLLSQRYVERVLAGHLATLGVRVERGVTATVVGPYPGMGPAVDVGLAGPAGTAALRARWVVLATGRDLADPDGSSRRFPGVVWVRADVRICAGRPPGGADWDPGTEHIFRSDGGHAGLVPLPDGGHRLFLSLAGDSLGGDALAGDSPTGHDPTALPVPATDIVAAVRRATGITVQVDPRSIWRHRPESFLTSRHRQGRILRVGEAAARFPMPVYGLNNAVQDAGNLGWKLAAVVAGQSADRLLDSFADERRAAATALLHRAERVLGHGSTASVAALRDRLRRGVFDMRGEPETRYDAGLLTVDRLPGAAGGLVPGQAATGPGAGRGDWTVVLVGRDGGAPPVPAADLAPVVAGLPAVCQVAVPDPAATPAVCVLRPDGHVGFRGSPDDVAGLRAYVRAVVTGGPLSVPQDLGTGAAQR